MKEKLYFLVVFRPFLQKFTLKSPKNVRSGRLEGNKQFLKISSSGKIWNPFFGGLRRGSVFEIFEITQNGAIREYKWFIAIFGPFTLGHQTLRLSNFLRNFENEDFSTFGLLDICYIAYNDSTYCFNLTTTNYLSGWRKYANCGQFCVKRSNFRFLTNFRFWVLEYDGYCRL